METYEQKYKDALERAKSAIKECGDNKGRIAMIESIFPELAESEDEKIRKALLELVHDTTGDELWIDYNVHKEDAIAWLEKQGKNKYLPNVTDRETLDEYAYQVAYDLSNDWLKDTPTWDDVERACKLGAEWNEKHRKSAWSAEDE